IEVIGVNYFMAVDGISLPLVLLTALLSAVAVLSSFSAVTQREKEYYVSLLLLETGMLGVFMALDLFLFYVFWEVMLVPMYFLIGVWGHERRLYAAIKFFLFTLFGSVCMLLGILALYFLSASPLTGKGTFDFLELSRMSLPLHFQLWIFSAFFIAFAIKVPMFPFHTWLPDAHVEAPTAGSVLLAGVLLKMGAYGFLRFGLTLFREASYLFAPAIAVLALIGIIYGAFVAMAQTDMKRLVAYSSVSHMGFVMLGIYSLTPQGLAGGLLQMVNHGLTTGALFLIMGMLYERRHTYLIAQYSGLSHRMPVFAAFFAITMLSSIGLPGLNNFIGEFLILLGAFQAKFVYAGVAVIGIVLGAAYFLWLYQRVMFGTLDPPQNKTLQDCRGREIIYMAPLLLLIVWIGLYPKPFLKISEATIAQLHQTAQEAIIFQWNP
ncbi:MAG: NADH-quinone oxidoreductase subunit M, partial [Candidatus Omnitrophota bacterium]